MAEISTGSTRKKSGGAADFASGKITEKACASLVATRPKSKVYLQQVFFLNQRINDSLQDLKELRLRAISIVAGPLCNDKVQGGKISDIVGDSVPVMVELDIQINAKIVQYVSKKQEIESLIEEIDDELLKSILLKRYVYFKDWQQIAADLGYTYRHITRLHGEALKEFEKKAESLPLGGKLQG